ncbi:hypothetical protein XENTR_v10022579 [Xenopus tropicalis]|nr:hypothetical protein XENTR_v10022579 [Xenopus tropicalis]
MLLKILSFSPVIAVQFNVISISSVVAALGSDVLLPCHLIPEMNAEKMEIRWFKPMYRPYVHLYINGKDDYTAQMPQFAQRTELLKENITRGIFPLKIRNVTAEDSGEYYCFVESSDHHGKAAVQLQVTAVFCSKQCGPLIKIVQAERGDALLQVNVTGTKDVYWNVISQDRSFAKTKPNGELDIRNNHYQGRLQGLNDSSLVISNLTRRDQANYTADINGDTLKCNQHYSLLVYKVLTGNDIQISNGSRGNETCNVTLTCEVNRLVGEDVTIAWNKTNIEYSKDPTIHLYNGEANSTYSCIAQNPVSAAYRSIEPSIFCPEQKRETPSKRNNNRHHIFWIPVVLILILLFAVVIIRRLNIGSSFFGFFQDE